ncbi:MAG: IS630 family transposase [Bacteroidales bacterium]|nr:IS630 family transposase [Bacteroidales bacterium]
MKKVYKKKLKLVWKRIRQSLKDRRPANYEEKKQELNKLKEQEKQGIIDLYYADGSGFSLIPTIPYAWQEIGERIELPCFKSKTLNLFGLWDAKKDLELYSVEGSMNSQTVLEFIDDFSKKLKNKKTVIVIDNASIHTSKLFKNKQIEWKKMGLEIFYLPSYSPHLNLIEHLWRFMKYEWIDFNVYYSWDNLVEYIENIAKKFGIEYIINFA